MTLKHAALIAAVLWLTYAILFEGIRRRTFLNERPGLFGGACALVTVAMMYWIGVFAALIGSLAFLSSIRWMLNKGAST